MSTQLITALSTVINQLENGIRYQVSRGLLDMKKMDSTKYCLTSHLVSALTDFSNVTLEQKLSDGPIGLIAGNLSWKTAMQFWDEYHHLLQPGMGLYEVWSSIQSAGLTPQDLEELELLGNQQVKEHLGVPSGYYLDSDRYEVVLRYLTAWRDLLSESISQSHAIDGGTQKQLAATAS
ncbi:hypothetical protein C1752_10445 [Acaryochloris thomasi RCC1774]|uniref:Uncharacterized protein n=1 Tax=Acaryochloris thomasi RCC1774 TaxID=1764569 RepID=A0A2W1JG11_9CYAN|nr:hypothetical protein [Acaryochloris thomasi]PZD70595.1 hypothetical protein C1752_10445 [Acaryochloris thomasi RCC1774]